MTQARPTVHFRDISAEGASEAKMRGFSEQEGGYITSSDCLDCEEPTSSNYEAIGIFVASIGIGLLLVLLAGQYYFKK